MTNDEARNTLQIPFDGVDHQSSESIGDSEPAPNSVVCGDAREVLPRIPSESIRLIVTSPPYWDFVDYGVAGQIGQSSYDRFIEDLLDVWKECHRVLAPNGKLCINTPILPIEKSRTPSAHTRELKNLNSDIEGTILNSTPFRRYSLYIWQKQTTEKMFGSYPYPPNIYENNTIEFINVFVKPGKPSKALKAVKEASRLSQDEWMDLTRQVWWMYPEDVSRNGDHPAPFPELLPMRLVRMYSFASVPEAGFPGDIVLDPFGGIGTTAVAAKTLGRRFISIDISSKYTEVALSRVNSRREYREFDVKLRRLADSDRHLSASVQDRMPLHS